MLEGKDAAAWAQLFEDRRTAFDARDRLGAAGPAGVPIAATLLHDPSPIVRGWACWVIVALGDPAATLHDVVFDLLSDADPQVQEEAIGAAGDMTETLGARLVQPARSILRNGTWRAKRRAADVLGALGEEAAIAIPELLACLRTEQFAADNAVRALLRIGEQGTASLARAWTGLSEEQRRWARVGEAHALVGRFVAPLLDSDDEALAEGARGIILAAGWRLLPYLDTHGSRETEGLREQVLAASVRDLIGPGENDVLEQGPPVHIRPDACSFAWETGSGHAQTFGLHRSRRSAAGLLFHTIAFSDSSLYKPDAQQQARVLDRGPVDSARLRSACELLSRILGARLVERPQDEDEMGDLGWFSTRNFHASLRVLDGEDVLFSETFTGYSGEASHRRSCRLEAAGRVLTWLLDGVPTTEVAGTEDDQHFLARRVQDADGDTWWVKTRLLATIGRLGDTRFEPLFRAQIEAIPHEYPWSHIAAIDAYARITGVDLRPTPFDRDDVTAVRAAYLKHFVVNPPPPR